MELQGKTAYIQNGEIWVANDDGSDPLQLTHTNGEVSTNENDGGLFAFSPDYNYLAYVIWPGGSSAYTRWTIAVLDVTDNQVVQQINGSTLNQFHALDTSQFQAVWVVFQDWVNDSQFVYNAWGTDSPGPGGGAYHFANLLMDLQKGTTTVQSL